MPPPSAYARRWSACTGACRAPRRPPAPRRLPATVADALARWNPRFLATVADAPGAAPVLRLEELRPAEARALRAAAAAVGARVALGPHGALVAGTAEQHAALAERLAAGAAPALGRAVRAAL